MEARFSDRSVMGGVGIRGGLERLGRDCVVKRSGAMAYEMKGKSSYQGWKWDEWRVEIAGEPAGRS